MNANQLKDAIETLIGLGEYEVETYGLDPYTLGEEELARHQQIDTACKWLTDNLDHIIADAEWDKRLPPVGPPEEAR